jgi:hypothetical protein
LLNLIIQNENSGFLNVALEPLYIHKEDWVVDYVVDRVTDRVIDRVIDRVESLTESSTESW